MVFSEFGASPATMKNWSLLAVRDEASVPVVVHGEWRTVLGIVYRAIATHLTRKAGCTKAKAKPGAVTLIQCFGGALNLNIHFHMLFLDGVFISSSNDHAVMFRSVKAPTKNELTRLTHSIAQRIGRYLDRQGLVERDTGNIYLTPEAVDASDEDPSNQLLGSSITYRIALGAQQGRKVFTLQTLPNLESGNPFSSSVGEAAGFSLHAGVATRANERAKLERLCRYITRPAISTKRLSLTRNGQVHYELKTPWRNGTTHIIFEPLDFIARLVALVPKPRVNLTRFHGVFAPNSKFRALVTPAKRGRGKTVKALNDQTPAEKRASMTWAKRLKRVFDIDIETCSECDGNVKIIASIEDPAVIKKILAHLDDNVRSAATAMLPDCSWHDNSLRINPIGDEKRCSIHSEYRQYSFNAASGVGEFVSMCERFAEALGEQFKPSQWLRRKAARADRIYPSED